jgi:2-oxo-4-hydroxy-4-carboxy--5-ureidoimidazoline (OHCU) decarboxylase
MIAPVQTLSGLNGLPAPSFVAALGEVFELAPWVAEAGPRSAYPTVTARTMP